MQWSQLRAERSSVLSFQPLTSEQWSDFLCRAVGQFVLAGKQTALALYELIGVVNDIDAITTTKINAFTDALALFQRGEFSAAEQAFRLIAEQYSDGPSKFYQHRCRANLDNEVHDEHGVIALQDK